MDALLTRTARQALEAGALGRRADFSGLLLGHKRGGRVIVEKIVFFSSDSFPSAAEYDRLTGLLEDEIVGFFSARPESPIRKSAPPPFSAGKIFLAVRAGRSGGCSLRAFLIDYTDRFTWKPLKLVSSEKDMRHA